MIHYLRASAVAVLLPACRCDADRLRGDPGRHFDLAGVDCSDGLARCSRGRVEISRAAFLSVRAASPERSQCVGAESAQGRLGRCGCPWDFVGDCADGCVVDGLEVVASRDVAIIQLCRSTDAAAAPPTAAPPDAEVCASEGTSCTDGLVRRCREQGRPSRVVARCLRGCETRIAFADDPGDGAIERGGAAILCRNDHAERR